MGPEDVNSIAGMIVMAGWSILIFGPRKYAALNAVPMWIFPGLLSAVYSVLILSRFSGIGGGFDSLSSVSALLQNEWALLAAWIHFLAFDLFVGAIMAARMDRVGISRLVQAPMLASMFMLGPLGFLIAALTELGLQARKIPTQLASLKDAHHVPA